MANLSVIMSLIDEVVAGTDSFIGLVILAVTITIALGVGALVTGMFQGIIKKINK